MLVRPLSPIESVVHADQDSGLGRFDVEGADGAGKLTGSNVPSREPKSIQLPSRNADHCGANIHSTPPPIVQPDLVLEVWPI